MPFHPGGTYMPNEYSSTVSTFTSLSTLQKAFNSLIGIIEGIVIDGAINDKEISVLREWVTGYDHFRTKHPFNELFPLVEQVLYERVMTEDERQDILWLCEKLSSEEYADKAVKDLQRLQAMLAGIIADGIITEEELTGLTAWLRDHEHLRNAWPYDQVYTIVAAVMSDKHIDTEEQKILQQFFTVFIPTI